MSSAGFRFGAGRKVLNGSIRVSDLYTAGIGKMNRGDLLIAPREGHPSFSRAVSIHDQNLFVRISRHGNHAETGSLNSAVYFDRFSSDLFGLCGEEGEEVMNGKTIKRRRQFFLGSMRSWKSTGR
jgi:hypothetical protein